MITVGNVLLALAAASLKITVILSLAALIQLASKRRSAAFHHMVWTVAVAGCLGVFLLAALLPKWPVVPVPKQLAPEVHAVALPAAQAPQQNAPLQEPAITEFPPRASTAANLDAQESSSASLPARPARHLTWMEGLVALWVVGMFGYWLHYLVGAIRLHRLQRSASLVSGESLVRFQQLAVAMNIRRPVMLYESNEIDVPMTWGTLYPRVVLPKAASEWNIGRLVSVLQHELAHVKRLDALTQAIANGTCAVFWFHPLVWLAAREMRLQRERACDDHVLAAGAVASTYASDLLDIVTSFRSTEQYPVALAMARRSQFEGRLLALLDPKIERGLLSSRNFALIVVVAVSFVVPLAAMNAVQDEPTGAPEFARADFSAAPATADPEETASDAETASVSQSESAPAQKSNNSAATAVSSGGMFAGCSRDTTSSTQSIHEDDDGNRRWSVKWKAGDCSTELRSEGKIKFNADLTGLQSISPGGYIEVQSNVHGEQTRLSVRPAGSGLEYKFWRNGQEEEFHSRGAQWLADYLVMLDRQSAFAIETRFPALMQAGGPPRVLDEAAQMYSDYAKANYLVRLQQTKLSPADLRRTFELAATVGSDYETARILIAASEKQDINDAGVRRAFLNAVGTLDSDYEHARTLMAFLEKGSPSPEQVVTLLSSTEKIESDYELGRVLTAVAQRHLLTPPAMKLYFKGLDRMGSDYERSQALLAALENYRVDDAVAMNVIQTAAKIGSDYEKSRVLVELAGKRPLEGALRDAYIKAGQQVGSDYHRKQVMEAVSRHSEMI
jgi:beta-lactamase regulating signal transducer with metallopeptidase domain